MAKKPSAAKNPSVDELRSLILRWRPGPIFDPIDMEHILQIDPNLGRQLTAQRLETQAEVQRALADGAAKAAKALKSGG